MNASRLRVLWGYHYFSSEAYPDQRAWNEAYLSRLREAGFDVEGFCLTIDPPGPYLSFRQLDRRWRKGDGDLLRMYERLEERLQEFDVLINSTGINLHPEFVERLPVFTVFQCFDDPESSDQLSRPVAASYDLCLVGNVAEVDTYKSWGVRNAEWTVRGLMPGLYDPTLTAEQIRGEERDIDLFMLADRLSPHRRERIDRLAAAFPDAHFFGRGWPRGYLPFDRQLDYLRRAKVGPNVHNSTGPVNLRTIYLPANGVLLVCDNKSHLGTLFDVGTEVVGFETIDEGIELCRYYLEHEEERRRIAAAGFRRAMADYTEEAVFVRALGLVEKHMDGGAGRKGAPGLAAAQRRKTRVTTFVTNAKRALAEPGPSAARLARKVLKTQ